MSLYVLILICISFLISSLSSSTSGAITFEFVSPISAAQYLVNSNVTVNISYQTNTSGTATQNCGGGTVVLAVTTNSNTTFTLPLNFVGSCTYTASIDGVGSPSPVSITVLKDVYFVAPTYPPIGKYAAGSNVFVQLQTFPNSSDAFSVQATCNGIPEKGQIVSAGPTGANLLIPSTAYGNCTYSIPPPYSNGIPSNSTLIIVTQNLTWILPTSDFNSTFPDDLTVLISANLKVQFNMTIKANCTESDNFYIFDVENAVSKNVTIPDFVFGHCDLNVIDAPDYIVIPSARSFVRSIPLQVNPISDTIIPGGTLEVDVGTPSGPIDLNPVGADLLLICGVSEFVYTWTNVTLNNVQSLVVPIDVPIRTDCFLQAIPLLDYLLVSAPVGISISIFPSPFGGPGLVPISQQESEQAAADLSSISDGWAEITRNIDNEY